MMSSSGGSDGLQFDRAVFEQAASARCALCQRPIDSLYFQVNDQMVCEACRHVAEASPPGSRLGRLTKAAALGVLAAALGSAIYYGVRALTGYEFGLIAVVVGLMVGGAVRKGSGGRGGPAYQALAMFLTYASIVSTYVPAIVEGFRTADTQQAGAPATAGAGGTPVVTTPATASAVPSASPPASGAAVAPDASVRPNLAMMGLAFVFLFALAFAAPFLAGFQNIIGLVIIGIGLYEAWKINRRTPVVVSGPYHLSVSPPPIEPVG